MKSLGYDIQVVRPRDQQTTLHNITNKYCIIYCFDYKYYK